MQLNNEQSIGIGSVEAARKVSANWSHETMTCHFCNCFSIVWGQGDFSSEQMLHLGPLALLTSAI